HLEVRPPIVRFIQRFALTIIQRPLRINPDATDFPFCQVTNSVPVKYAGRFTLCNLQGTFVEGSLKRAKGDNCEGKTLAFSNGNLNLIGVSVGRHPKRRSKSRESYRAYVPIESSRRGLEGRKREADWFVWCELI
ncbi:MAG: hypothetical protein ACUVSC_05990, partial [Candidatus Fervidibacter sp.]|uniref:hypothetical protein n=1 Tax=Candidatus Fervidibacter sp. TaxID=3100871 RepID=UPI00404A1056